MAKNRCILLFWMMMTFSVAAVPYFGGYLLTDNRFNNDYYKTLNSAAFFINVPVNENVLFYSRISAGFIYDAKYNTLLNGGGGLRYFTFFPSLDLMYIEFKSGGMRGQSYGKSQILEKNDRNFDFFTMKLGRVPVTAGDGFYYSMKGDGMTLEFTVGNFFAQIYGTTNALDYLPYFDMTESGSSPVFTRWDLKRIPALSDKDRSVTATDTTSYNFYIDSNESSDYTKSEASELNALRDKAVLAGRIFPGFTVGISEIYYQNFTFNMTANIDLIPEEFVITHPSLLSAVSNTFGGKYTSFYVGFGAHGRIWRDLYYNADLVYETGANATYINTGTEIEYENRLINSFAGTAGLIYFFNALLHPTAALTFSYAHGDEDAVYPDDTVINKEGDDNGFRGVTQYYTGYVLAPYFTNLMTISFKGSLLPLDFLRNQLFSRLIVKNEVLLMMRPVFKGAGIYTEKSRYRSGGADDESTDKMYLGTEVNGAIGWQLFSDLGIEYKVGIFIPNYTIYDGDDPFWKTGISLNFSF